MGRITLLDKTFETSISAARLSEVVDGVATRLNADLAGRDPLFLCVLNGAFMFAADLMKRLTIPLQISFVKLASYAGTQSTGKVKELIGLNESLEGRNVVLVEDIVDTGFTIRGLREQCRARGAASVAVTTLIFKPQNCTLADPPEYVGLSVPNDFIVGYGLDYNGYGRNLPEIMTLVKPQQSTTTR